MAKKSNNGNGRKLAMQQSVDQAVKSICDNPNKKPVVDTRTPEELLDLIEAKGREIAEALAVLRKGGTP